jgi:AAA15 family ATPase/GTPase
MILDDVSHAAYFEHTTEDGSQGVFAENDESAGTKALLSILPLIFNVLQAGKVLVWDELETSLHPHVAELIVDLFNDPEINTKHAQLLFTTHNVALMNPDKLRKVQFWLTEKIAGAMHLISMDEFESSQLKNNSPFAKWYYDGRLGGLPAINYSKVKELFSTLTRESEENGKNTQKEH